MSALELSHQQRGPGGGFSLLLEPLICNSGSSDRPDAARGKYCHTAGVTCYTLHFLLANILFKSFLVVHLTFFFFLMQAQRTSQKLGGRNWRGIHMNSGERKICYGKLLGKEIKRQDVWTDLSRNGAGCWHQRILS